MKHKYSKFSELKEQKIIMPNVVKQKYINRLKYQFLDNIIKLHNEKKSNHKLHFKRRLKMCFEVD